MADDCVIELRGLRTRVGGNLVHDGIDLCVRRGEVLAIVGESGGGKTTLLRVMLGLQATSGGTVRVFGCPLADAPPAELQRVRQRWGVLFQQGALFSALSVFENVALPLRELRALPRDVIRELAMIKLGLVEIDEASAGKLPAQLSGGMIKRVALARAIALDPELLFVDEPTAGLDPERSALFVALVERLRRELQATVVMVTHDMQTLIALADRVAVLADRRLVTVGPLWEVADFDHPMVQSLFLGQRERCARGRVEAVRRALAEGRQAVEA